MPENDVSIEDISRLEHEKFLGGEEFPSPVTLAQALELLVYYMAHKQLLECFIIKLTQDFCSVGFSYKILHWPKISRIAKSY